MAITFSTKERQFFDRFCRAYLNGKTIDELQKEWAVSERQKVEAERQKAIEAERQKVEAEQQKVETARTFIINLHRKMGLDVNAIHDLQPQLDRNFIVQVLDELKD